ncbi:MAG TPA: SDR family NAD(P)-dependent oxidoreductase [Tissierellaceae bacterium]|nr:SDR family NAD(P)-dependent oxidoreductase [Tissierellaceae bacterium]
MAFSMKDKNVIVTGGSKGIGYGITNVFAEEGANVIFTGRNEEDGRKAENNLEAENLSAEFYKADVLDFDKTKELFKYANEKLGSIDILILNAGVFPETSIEDMEIDQWDQVVDINLKSNFIFTKEVIPYMKKNGGRIVITSSITGNKVGNPELAHYSAAKAGINGFIKTAALELAPYNITINGVEPGNIMTPGMKDSLGDEYIEKQKSVIPLDKLGDPKDIAYAMIYLASDESKYITGQTITVDGGQILPESAFDIR